MVLIDWQRRNIASPCPTRHDRTVYVDDVGQVARKCRRLNCVVIGALREAFQGNGVIGLRCVEVCNDLVDQSNRFG